MGLSLMFLLLLSVLHHSLLFHSLLLYSLLFQTLLPHTILPHTLLLLSLLHALLLHALLLHALLLHALLLHALLLHALLLHALLLHVLLLHVLLLLRLLLVVIQAFPDLALFQGCLGATMGTSIWIQAVQVVVMEGTIMDPALLNMTSAPGVVSMAILKVSALRPSELLMLDTRKTSVAIVDILSIYLDLALLSRILA